MLKKSRKFGWKIFIKYSQLIKKFVFFRSVLNLIYKLKAVQKSFKEKEVLVIWLFGYTKIFYYTIY